MSRPLPQMAVLSLCLEVTSRRQQQTLLFLFLCLSFSFFLSVPVSSGLRSPFGTRGERLQWGGGLSVVESKFDERGLLLSGPHHVTLVHNNFELQLWMWVII